MPAERGGQEKSAVRRRGALAAFGLGALALAGEAARCRVWLTCREYTLPLRGVEREVRFVFFSDLHGLRFGRDNERLLRLVRAQQPAFIALPGDLIDRHGSVRERERVCALLRRLREIAPVYVSPGNHERDVRAARDPDILKRYQAAGAQVLAQRWTDIAPGGVPLRLGGTDGSVYRDENGAFAFLDAFCATERPTILLQHRPDGFTRPPRGSAFKSGAERWSVGLLLCGHTHGGLFRPLGRGVVVPAARVYPRVYYGRYALGRSALLVTSGLAGARVAPRLFNPPEICAVTLRGENTRET